MRNNKVSPFVFKLMMNFYPPFLFGRVSVKHVAKDFTSIQIQIKQSLFNKNLSGSMFGGTLFSAADPFYAMMYWQIFAHRYSKRVIVWLKSAEIKYKKPAIGDMFLDFELSEEHILDAKEDLEEKGKHNKEHQVLIKDKFGETCAIVKLVTYVGL